MISFRSGSCLSKLERVKANIIKVPPLEEQNHMRHYILKTIAMFAFTRFYLRVLADLNEIIRRRKRNDIFRIAIDGVLKQLLLSFYFYLKKVAVKILYKYKQFISFWNLEDFCFHGAAFF